MPLRYYNTRSFHRRLYGGILETVTLLKRNNDQQEGTVKALQLFECRRSRIQHSGEPLLGTMASEDRTRWHIPRTELDRYGVSELNALDRIKDKFGQVWQPESTTMIDIALFKNQVHLDCRRTN